jgi:hypothetical protein
MHEKIEQIINHKLAIPVAIGAISAGVGVSTGYVFGLRRGYQKAWNEVVDLFDRDEEERHIPGEPVEAEVTLDEPPRIVIDADEYEAVKERWESEDIAASEQIISERTLDPDEVRRATEEIALAHTAAVERTYPQAVLDAAEQAGVTPQQMAEDVQRVERALERDSIKLGELVEESPEPVPTNIFANTGEGWDYEAELLAREGQTIFVIHADEYNAQEEDYAQITLTYYEGDDLMADDNNDMVTNHERTVGELRFGHGSNDPNLCYIRNVEREADYEVLRHTGKFTEEVMGLDIESVRAQTRIHRMREDRDT